MNNVMTNEQKESWKRVRNAGTAALIIGWIEVFIYFILLLFAVFLIAMNTQIRTGDNPTDTMSSAVLGGIFCALVLILLPFSVLNIVAGVKLRKPVANPRGWTIYLIVMGVIGFTSLQGIIELIFGIIAYSSLPSIENTQPPQLSQLRD